MRTIVAGRIIPWSARPESESGANQRGTHDNGTKTQSSHANAERPQFSRCDWDRNINSTAQRLRGHHSAIIPIYFFLACDLNEIPKRSDAFLIDLGDRPKILMTCSNDVEARASSINRRSSFNDQRDLRTITNLLFRTNPPTRICLLGSFAVWVRTF
jgi:hypothetical protein